MKVTSSAVFERISKRYLLTVISDGTENLPVRLPKLFTFEEPEEEVLYICEWDEVLLGYFYPTCSYMIISRQIPQIEPPAGCEIAFVREDISALKLLYETFEEISGFQEWDLKLKEASSNSGGLPRLVEACRFRFPYPLAIVDRNFNIIEVTPDYDIGFEGSKLPEGIKIPVDRVSDLLLEPDFAKAETVDGVFPYPFDVHESRLLCVNILNEGHYLARILAQVPKGATPGLRYLFKHMCRYLRESYISYKDDVLIKRQNDKIHQLFRRLLFGPEEVGDRSICSVIERYGWCLRHEYTVNVIEISGHKEFDIVALYLCSHLEKDWPDSCAIKGDNEIIWIVNHSLCSQMRSGGDFSLAFVYLIRDFCCKAGISASFQICNDLSMFYRQAKAALEIGSRKNSHLWYYRFANYTLDYMFRQLTGDIPKEQLCHPGLMKLIEADRENGGELVKVLYYYIKCHYNTSLAADNIFVHRSTFIRQLERIKNITGIDWKEATDMDTLLHILASFKLLGITY